MTTINTYKITLILFVILLTAQCSVDKKESDKTIDIEANVQNFKGVKLSELAEQIEYIPLQTDSSNMLERISTIDISDKYIFINGLNSCFLFDRNGKFLSQIGRKGKGPGEYLYPGSVEISGEYLFVANLKNILVYNVYNKFIANIDVKTAIGNGNDNFFPLSDSLIILHIRNGSGDEKYKATIYDLKSNAIHSFNNYYKYEKLKPSSNSMDGDAQFYCVGNLLFYKELFNDTIFRINAVNDSYKMKPSYSFHLGKYRYPQSFRSLSSEKKIKEIFNYIWILNIYETRTRIFMRCNFGNHNPLKTQKKYVINGETTYGRSEILGIYDKNNGETFFNDPLNPKDEVNPNGIINDLDGGMNFIPKSKVNDSTLAMTINAFDLKSYINSEVFKNSTPLYPEKKKELEKLAKRFNENDNPVLVLVKMKE
jgi:hypothetical protein